MERDRAVTGNSPTESSLLFETSKRMFAQAPWTLTSVCVTNNTRVHSSMCIHVLHCSNHRWRPLSDRKQMLLLIFRFWLSPQVLLRKMNNSCENVRLLNLSPPGLPLPSVCERSVFSLTVAHHGIIGYTLTLIADRLALNIHIHFTGYQ